MKINIKFLLFNFLLSIFFIYSQKIFNNNMSVSNAIFWIGLMIFLPLGAALYNSKKLFFVHHMVKLFYAAWIWLICCNILVNEVTHIFVGPLHPMNPKAYIILENIIAWSGLYGIMGIVSFAPAFLVFGIMDLHLYSELANVNQKKQWIAYLFGLVGLILGQILHMSSPIEPSVTNLGCLSLISLMSYVIVARFPFKRNLFILCNIIIGILIFNSSYVRGIEDLNRDGINTQVVFDQWNKNLRLTVLKRKNILSGYYNGIFHWHIGHSFLRRVCLDFNYFVPQLIEDNSTIALIGSGGGSQLSELLAKNPTRLYAVDVVPDLFLMMSNLGVHEYSDPRVETINYGGRHFIEQSQEQFDLIFLPNTESIFKLSKSLFEPADHLFTFEAFKEYYVKLNENGVLALVKSQPFNKYSNLAANYMETMRAAGFNVQTHSDKCSVTLIGTKNQKKFKDVKNALSEVMKGSQRFLNISKRGNILRDDRPFLASVLFNENYRKTFFVLSIVFIIPFLFFVNKFKEKDFPAHAALCCGINYTLLLLCIQLNVFFHIRNPLDAAIWGNIIFLFSICFGVILYRHNKIKVLLSFLIMAMAFVNFERLYIWSLLVLCLWSGGFFVKLLQENSKQISKLLIFDGMGAVCAGLIYLIIPTVWGIKAFMVSVGGIFLLTFCLVHRVIQIKK